MNRRAFLEGLIGGLALDPERALWIPGRKLISIPSPRIDIAALVASDMMRTSQEYQKMFDRYQKMTQVRYDRLKTSNLQEALRRRWNGPFDHPETD